MIYDFTRRELRQALSAIFVLEDIGNNMVIEDDIKNTYFSKID